MRIAVTIGTLRIPPTYFAVQHAAMLADRHQFQVFTLAANVTDAAVPVDIRDFVPWRSLPFRRREVLIPAFMRTMSSAIAAFEPDVVHQHFATWSRPAVRAAHRARVPLVTTLHGVDVFTALEPAGSRMHRWHLRNIADAQDAAAMFLPVSEYLRDRAVEAGYSGDRMRVHYQGIDTDFFKPLPTPSRDVPTVVFAGALSQAKGVMDAVRASVAVHARLPHRLVIIGDGPLRDAVRTAAAEHPHIAPVGTLTRDEVRTTLQEGHCLVLPTQEAHGRREAAGLVLLEAQACGLPVITYRSGGAPEMLREGETGLVVPERDHAGLEDALAEALLLDATAYRRMSTAARDFVVNHRSLVTSAQQLEEIYESVG